MPPIDKNPSTNGTTSAEESDSAEVELYTDGACSGNPGKGGWAFILRHRKTGKEIERAGGERETTNNRMELLAVIRGLEALNRSCQVDLYTDSEYVGKGIRDWMPAWKRRGWKRAGGKTVKNVDLWKELDKQLARHTVHYHAVRGHSGHPENERCDELAVQAYQEMDLDC